MRPEGGLILKTTEYFCGNLIVGNSIFAGSGCDSVGRGDASLTRGLWFESSHRPNFIMNIFAVKCRKEKNKENRGLGMVH